MLFVALLAIVASASASLRPPVFSSTENCGFLPLRLPSAPMAPPDPRVSEDVLCKDVRCPKAPSNCVEDSVCVWGQCMPHVPKADYTPCNDGYTDTIDDVCSAGTCRGLTFSCPADVRVRPTRDNSGLALVATWDEPEVTRFHSSVMFSVSSSHRSGEQFPVGVTTVGYTATNVETNEEYTCDFKVEVLAEESPCDDFKCAVDNVCQRSIGGCFIMDAAPMCPEPEVVPNGLYNKEELYRNMNRMMPARERYASRFQQFDNVKCNMGKSVCEGTLRMLPPRLPKPPMMAPRFLNFQAPKLPSRPDVTQPPRTVAPSTTTRHVVTTTRTPSPPAPTTTVAAPTTRCAPMRACNCKPGTRYETFIDSLGCAQCSCAPMVADTTTTRAPATTTRAPATTTAAPAPATTTRGSAQTTQAPQCEVRVCNCKPGTVVETFINADGCESCACKAPRRRLLAEEPMSSMDDEPKSQSFHSLPGMMVISAMVVAAVVVVGFVAFRQVGRKEEDALPFVATSSNFKPLDTVRAD
eukprot:m.36166 g.36166  ORF g.36166 m.36166 type:complete len:524 (-) comp12455_c0_seq1:153-1724(-)